MHVLDATLDKPGHGNADPLGRGPSVYGAVSGWGAVCVGGLCRHYSDVGNTLATVFPPQPRTQGGVRKCQKRFVPGCCIPCGGANLQQGPTTVKHDTGASVQSPASSPHTTPTPNQDAPSRHYSDAGNTLATVFPPPQPGTQGGVGKHSETVCTRLLRPLWWCKLAAGTHYSQT